VAATTGPDQVGAHDAEPAGPALFEYEKGASPRGFRGGKFDAVEVVSEVFERDLFSSCAPAVAHRAGRELPGLPRKGRGPVCSTRRGTLAMRLHGRHSFHSFRSWCARAACCRSWSRKGPARIDPRAAICTWSARLQRQEHYHRRRRVSRLPAQDGARTTLGAPELVRLGATRPLKKRHGFDRRGHLRRRRQATCRADNPAYEGSTKMWFDEHTTR